MSDPASLMDARYNAWDDKCRAEREESIERARSAWSYQWPEQLTSGVMFYEGQRITRAEFESAPRRS